MSDYQDMDEDESAAAGDSSAEESSPQFNRFPLLPESNESPTKYQKEIKVDKSKKGRRASDEAFEQYFRQVDKRINDCVGSSIRAAMKVVVGKIDLLVQSRLKDVAAVRGEQQEDLQTKRQKQHQINKEMLKELKIQDDNRDTRDTKS